jgi:hypothetical protein
MVLGVTAAATKLLALLHVFDFARLRSVFGSLLYFLWTL